MELTPELFNAVQAARSALGALEAELVQIQGGQDFKTLEDRLEATIAACTDSIEKLEQLGAALGSTPPAPEPEPEPEPEP